MKNLKRVLSLALTGVMLVGMMAMSASAVNAEDFTDASEIQHTEAVSIATALKIIDGNDDGSFDPDGLVTRGQMAKMITRAMYGGTDPVLGVKTTPSFTDIAGRWDESYIEYCYSQGIVSGRGDGTFDPEGQVTGTEAAKMLLTALGYQADIYQMIGADWAVNTNAIANDTKVGLYDDLKGLDPNAAFTRDQVAQMVYNAVNADTKKMTPTTSTNGTIEYTYTDGDPFLYERYGAVRVEGVVTKNEFNTSGTSKDGKTDISITNGDELGAILKTNGVAFSTAECSQTLEVSTGKDEIGKAVIIYVKPSAASKTSLNKGTVISDVVLDDNTVITKTKALSGDPVTVNSQTYGKKTVAAWLHDNGLEFVESTMSATPKTQFVTNYGTAGDITIAQLNVTNTAGTEYIAVDNDGDGVADYVFKNTTEFGQVAKWDEKNEKVTVRTTDGTFNIANQDMDDVVAYEGIAVDDYVNVTKVADKWYVTAAEKVDGALDDYDGKDQGDTITVDGESYTISKNKGYEADGLTGAQTFTTSLFDGWLDEDVTLYLDAYGYVAAATSEAATDWLFVANASHNNTATTANPKGTVTVYVYFEDGTSGSYTVNKIDNDSSHANLASGTYQNLIGKIFKYTVTSNDKLNLTSITASSSTIQAGKSDAAKVDAGSNEIKYSKGQSTLTYVSNTTSRAATRYITNDTVVFFVSLKTNNEIDKVNVYTGKTSPSVKYNGAFATGNTEGELYVSSANNGKFNESMLLVTNEDDANNLDAVAFTAKGTVGSDWVFVIDYVRTNSNGAIYNAIVDGDLVVLETNDDAKVVENTAYTYDMDGDLYDLDTTPSAVMMGNVTLIDDDSIVIKAANGNSYEFDITSNTVTALIDSDDTDIGASAKKNDTVYVIYNNSNDMDAEGIFILEEYDEANKGLVGYNSTLVTYDSAAKAYKPSIAAMSTATVSANAAGVKSLFTIPAKATAILLKAEPSKDDNGYTATITSGTADTADTFTASTDMWLVIVPETQASNTDYTVVKITLQA